MRLLAKQVYTYVLHFAAGSAELVAEYGAAYAELGDFETALRVQRRALEFTITRTGLNEVNLLLTHLESRQPIRLRNGLAHRGPIGKLPAPSD